MSNPRIRINSYIKAPELRVIGSDGSNLGVLSFAEAMRRAQAENLDLIEIAPTATPPVAKIMDYGKFQYDEKKKLKESKARVVVATGLKSLQVKIGTGDHDLALKAKKASQWLEEGSQVRINLYLIGRSKYMDFKFLKERLERILKLISVEYRFTEEPTKGPKGLTSTIEKVK